MYAYPFVVLLTALWADQQEQATAPPPQPKPAPPGGYGALSRAEMVSYGAPGSWEAAWHGTRYGSDPVTARIEAINHEVMKIIKKVLGWAVATKGPKLISLNSQRDTLIKQGVPLNDPRVANIENKAMSILQAAGLNPSSPKYQTIKQLGAQRDQLLRQQAGLA